MTMTEKDWQVLKHFSIHENWGEPEKMSAGLIYELDAYREFINTPVFVSCGTNKGHTTGSEHYLGLAVDILFPERGVKDMLDLFFVATRFGFRGIGLYNHWQYQGKVIGGIHLDWRTARTRALWLGVLEPDSNVGMPSQVYREFNLVNLNKYGFV